MFAKDYIPNRSEEVFVVKKVKNNLPWIYVIRDLNGEQIVGSFYEKELQKTKKVIKRQTMKSNKLYVKWKGYNDKEDTIISKSEIFKRKCESGSRFI